MVLNFATLIVLTRYLSVALFGDYSFVQNYITGFVLLTDLGVTTIILRELSAHKHPAQWIIERAITVRLAISVVAFGVAIGSAALLGYNLQMTLALLVYGVSLLFTPLDVMTSWFQAELRSRSIVWTNTLSLFIASILTVAGAWLGASLTWLVAVLIGQLLLRYGLLYMVFHRQGLRLRLRIDLTYFWYVIKQALPLTVAFLLLNFCISASLVILSKSGGSEEIAYYSAGSRLNTILTFLPQAVAAAVFPAMVGYFNQHDEGGQARLYKLYFSLRHYFILLALLLAITTTFFASQIITLLFGAKYLDGTSVLQIIIWYVALVYIATPGGSFLNACNHQKIYGIAQSSSALVLLGASSILCIAFKADGLSMAYLLSCLVINAVQEFYIWRIMRVRSHPAYVRFAVLAGGLVGLCWLLTGLNVILALGIVTISYMGAAYALGLISKEDIELVRSRFGRKGTTPVPLPVTLELAETHER